MARKAGEGLTLRARKHLISTGWYFATWLWALRGWLDLLFGGVGMRRGRRDPDNLQPGDALDFWRVEDVKRPQFLRLRAEMKLPGRAWLQWEVKPDSPGHAVIHQTAIFDPVGILGLAYCKQARQRDLDAARAHQRR
jgi:hypothetical protein